MYPGSCCRAGESATLGPSKPDFFIRYYKYFPTQFTKNSRAAGETKTSWENVVEYSTAIFEVVSNMAVVVCRWVISSSSLLSDSGD